jgi:ribonuclease T1
MNEMNTLLKNTISRFASVVVHTALRTLASTTAGLFALSLSFVAVDANARASCALAESIAVKDLPKQGRDTLELIKSGGSFPHDRDGVVFGNREKILPKAKRGYYREYTVRTPGVKHRGARRIVCGGDQRAANECYYSADHYKTFQCIAQ